MATTQLGQTPEGLLLEALENPKSRMTAVYYRPVKDKSGTVTDWIETAPLPSDPLSRIKYIAKGFRLSLPSENGTETSSLSEDNTTLLEENARLRAELEALKSKPPTPLYVKGQKVNQT